MSCSDLLLPPVGKQRTAAIKEIGDFGIGLQAKRFAAKASETPN